MQAPICDNHAFLPPWDHKSYYVWKGKGLIKFKDLYIDGKFASFNQLKQKFDLPHSHFYRYLQVRHFMQSNMKNYQDVPREHNLFKVFLSPPYSKHLISTIVHLFDDSIEVQTTRIRDAWREELGIEISESMWDKCLSKIHSCSVNSRHQLIQFKIVHRLHYSKVRLHKIYPSTSPICDRCKTSESTLAHAFWHCPSLTNFWSKIFDWYSKAYGISISPNPEIAVFGCVRSRSIPATVRVPIDLGMMIAKRLILKEWKSAAPPSFSVWLNDMLSVIQLEKVRYLQTPAANVFSKSWTPFCTHLEKAHVV